MRLRAALFSLLSSREAVAEENLARNVSAAQDALSREVMGNVSWIPGPSDPTDGLTKRKTDLVRPLPILMRGESQAEERRSPKKSMVSVPHQRHIYFILSLG